MKPDKPLSVQRICEICLVNDMAQEVKLSPGSTHCSTSFPVQETGKNSRKDCYEACCTALEKLSGQDEWRQKLREELRRKRSLCLNLMQKLGIDTSDWARINDFCSNPRIVGKAFRQITVDELDELAVKLRSIQRKGGLKPRKEKQTINPVSMVSLIQIDPDAPAN